MAGEYPEVILTPDHRYVEIATGRQIQSVTTILRKSRVREAPFTGRNGVGGGPYAENMRKALQRGSEVHRLTRAIDEAGGVEDAFFDIFDPADLSAENINYVSAYQKFLGMGGYKPTAWERVVYSRQYDFAGRVDGVGWLGHERVMIDRKSGSVDKSVWLQLGGYKLAWDEMHQTEKIDRTFAVLLKKDMTFSLIPNPIEAGAGQFFVAALWIARFHEMAL